MADKTNHLVSHFFVQSDYFLQFGSLRDFRLSDFGGSTVLVQVNLVAKSALKILIMTLQPNGKRRAFFLCKKRTYFLVTERR